MTTRILPLPALVLLVGPAGAGKSTWASEHFHPGEVVSSDQLRQAVGSGPTDMDASAPAFDILGQIVRHRLDRGLTAVVDTVGLDPAFRQTMLAEARSREMRAIAVLFDTPAETCRARNRSRPTPVPAGALTAQIRNFRRQRRSIEGEGWDVVTAAEPVTAVSERSDDVARVLLAPAPEDATIRFGLQLSAFPWPPDQIADRLRDIVAAAEEAGFSSLWVMDHLIQIPQVGRRWDAMLEGPTTLAWLAAVSSTLGLGTLVSNTSLRNPAHLAKLIATLDVLSQGRARAGLGAGWWKHEMTAYGLELPTVGERLDRLEDALELLPLMWGPGTVDFEGRTLTVKGAECYPRPIQDHVPLLVGGQGPRRTLKLAARYADAVNLRGDPETVGAAVDVLRKHCRDVDRDPDEVEITHLSWPMVATTRSVAAALRERFRGGDTATLDEHTGRVQRLVDVGVTTFLLSVPDLVDGADAVRRRASLVERFT